MIAFPLDARRLANSTLARWLIAGGILAFAGVTIIRTEFQRPVESFETESDSSTISNEPIQPIEPASGLDPKKVDLGRKLFFDPLLSHNDQLSCSSCHNLSTGGTDRKVRSLGINGSLGVINAPTVLNSGLNFSQFWDGRAATLDHQIDEPVLSKIEMGSTWPEVINKLKSSPDYVHAFREIYGGDIQREQVEFSVAEFERSLMTPNSRFDQYLRHNKTAISPSEEQGYQLFKSLGCASCHQGVNVGGNMYQKLGVMAPYFTDRGNVTRADRGRFNVTGDPKDMYMFKVPTLRNVELTPPYFHDGSAQSLPDAVRMMAKYQLGRRLSDREVELIVEFLKTLTGELNGQKL